MLKRIITMFIFIILLSLTPIPILFFVLLFFLFGHETNEFTDPLKSEIVNLWHEMILRYDLDYLYSIPVFLKIGLIIMACIITLVTIIVIGLKIKAFVKKIKLS